MPFFSLSPLPKCRCAERTERQMPRPDLTALKDDIGTLPESGEYLPAAMQLLHYYTEMMTYEQLAVPARDPPVTTRRPAAATTTKRATTTTTRRTTTTTTTRRTTTTTPKTTTRRTTTERPTPQRTTTTTRRTTKRPTYSTTRRPTTVVVQQDVDKFPYATEINIWRKLSHRIAMGAKKY
jgi:hypothetical protein